MCSHQSFQYQINFILERKDLLLNYEEFICYVKTKVQEKTKENVQIELHQVMKNNGVKMDGLTIMEKEGNISPTIYLNGYYKPYQEGMAISEIVEDIMEIYTQNKSNIQLDTEFYKDFDKVKEHVVCKLIHYERNKELLEKIPYIQYLDMAVVFCYIMKNDIIGNGSILIYNNHLKMWNISKEKLHEIARKNTLVMRPYQLLSMKEVIHDILGETQIEDESDDIPMYVLSNQDKSMGAAYILYDTVLSDIGNILKENFYVLPSSIHECIIVPDSVETPKEELVSMVREINETQVLPEEVLSDNIYYYACKNHRLSTLSIEK